MTTFQPGKVLSNNTAFDWSGRSPDQLIGPTTGGFSGTEADTSAETSRSDRMTGTRVTVRIRTSSSGPSNVPEWKELKLVHCSTTVSAVQSLSFLKEKGFSERCLVTFSNYDDMWLFIFFNAFHVIFVINVYVQTGNTTQGALWTRCWLGTSIINHNDKGYVFHQVSYIWQPENPADHQRTRGRLFTSTLATAGS